MTEYTLVGLAGASLVAATLILYFAITAYTDNKKKYKAAKKRYAAYKRQRRQQAMQDRIDLFNCYLITLGVK